METHYAAAAAAAAVDTPAVYLLYSVVDYNSSAHIQVVDY